MKNLSAILLAGRENRHLKTTKWTLPFGPTTVLGRTLEAYLGAGVDEVILVLGSRAQEILSQLPNLDRRVKVESIDAADAPYGSLIKAGAKAVSSGAKAFCFGSGDQPLLSAERISEVVDRFESTKAKILVPVCQGSVGSPAVFDASYLDTFRKLSDTGEVWDVLQSNGKDVQDYHVFHTSFVRDIDDLEDYHEMLRIAGLPIPDLSARLESGAEVPASNGAVVEASPAAE